MKRTILYLATLFLGLSEIKTVMSASDPCKDILDEHLKYLEEVEGKTALDWVEEQNEIVAKRLELDPRFEEIKKSAKNLFDSPDRLVIPTIRLDKVLDFWADAQHVKGIFRTASLESYMKGEPQWETLLDIDKLAKDESEDWVFKASDQYKNRTIISLSRGGGDAVVLREFDLETKTFVKDGFNIDEAVGNNIIWFDENTLFVMSVLEGGESTRSRYPMTVRRWKRGHTLKEAEEIFRGDQNDIYVHIELNREKVDGKIEDIMIHKGYSFNDALSFYLHENGQISEIKKPQDSKYVIKKDLAYVYLNDDFVSDSKTKFPAGSIIVSDKKSFLEGNPQYKSVYIPKPNESLVDFSVFNDRIVVVLGVDVNQKLIELRYDEHNQSYLKRTIVDPLMASISLYNANSEENRVFYKVSSFLDPAELYLYDVKKEFSQFFEKAPERFNKNNYKVQQLFSTSRDGTKVPFYLLSKKDIQFTGDNPTIIYGYGGFNIGQSPNYSALTVKTWLDFGGVWALTNIRGGNEYGPNWWRQALQENRQKSYDDMISVAEELHRISITSPEHTGVYGGSNGGLLTGNMLVQRPDLFSGVVSSVPLLDMLRFHLLLRGASWQDEYGYPDNPLHREHLLKYSPFHNLNSNKEYPEPLFMTSTKDDRVHPGHARKMAAKMQIMGKSALLYENRVGGHGGATNNEQKAHARALMIVYFLQKLL